MFASEESTSVLIIGATGRTGLECLKELAAHPSKPAVHAFLRNLSKLSPTERKSFDSITEGDARKPEDLERGLRQSKASDVVVCVGNGDDVRKTDIRTANAQALATVLRKAEFSKVRVMLISSNGAGDSVIKVGMGIGALISFHLRHVMADHSNQEAALEPFRQRLTVVRPTSLGDGEPTGKTKTFGDKSKPPTIKIERADVAAWVVREICDNGHATQGRTVNLTGIHS